MAREIPEVVRAAAGLAATVLDEARKLPEMLPGLPVRLIGLAMQHAMKAQQQYAGLVARGDELFTGLRGEDEPGLATFDDDDDFEPPVTPAGFRESAFDRAGDTEPTSASVDVATAEELGEQIDEAQQSLELLAEEAPDTETILDEIAIDELVDQAPTLEDTAPAAPAAKPKAATTAAKKAAAPQPAAEPTAAETLDAEPTADVATTVDDLTAAGDVAPETTNPAPASAAAATTEPSRATNSSAPRTAAVDGYDSFSLAQLRGRLRGYALTTVQDLLAYEEATRSRAPYLTMLHNRLEKLEEQAVASSPLAPRGA